MPQKMTNARMVKEGLTDIIEMLDVAASSLEDLSTMDALRDKRPYREQVLKLKEVLTEVRTWKRPLN